MTGTKNGRKIPVYFEIDNQLHNSLSYNCLCITQIHQTKKSPQNQNLDFPQMP